MIKPDETINLKHMIKQEMARRNGYGSLTEFAGSKYDFVVQPKYGEKMKPEFGQKTIDLLLQIQDHGDLRNVKEDDPIPVSFDSNLLEYVRKLASETATGATTDVSSCRSACTGLCVGSCISHCNGCSGCSASCGTGCAGKTMVSAR